MNASAYFILRCVSCCHIMTYLICRPEFFRRIKRCKNSSCHTLHREGVTDDEYRPYEGCNATQMAFIADSIATICNISYQWKAFGNYRHLSVFGSCQAQKTAKAPRRKRRTSHYRLVQKTPKPTTFCWVLPFIPLMFHLH